jgi:hypothetical protein
MVYCALLLDTTGMYMYRLAVFVEMNFFSNGGSVDNEEAMANE